MLTGEHVRDIRADLQDRATRIEEQIAVTQTQFDTFIEQLEREHRSKLEDLKSELDIVHRVMKTEDRLIDVLSPSGAQSEPSSPQQPEPQQAQSQQAISEFLTRKVSALSMR
jgi:hypothetical protein